MAKSNPEKQVTAQAELVEAVRRLAGTMERIDGRKPSDRRIQVGAGLIMIGNAAAAALLFGQAFSGFPFDVRYAGLGALTILLTYSSAIAIMEGGDEQ